jgi:hypothetical protein
MNSEMLKRGKLIIQNEGYKTLLKKTYYYLNINAKFEFNTQKNYIRNLIMYDDVPHPRTKLLIRPLDVKWQIGRDALQNKQNAGMNNELFSQGLGNVYSGDWDKNRSKITENLIIQSILDRYQNNADWSSTKLYDKYVQEGHSKGQIEAWLAKIDDLYENIRNDGYRHGHSGLHNRDVSQPIRDRLEVLVNIDRNGTLGFFEGNHRWGIACCLDIEIPVQVFARHKNWVAKSSKSKHI